MCLPSSRAHSPGLAVPSFTGAQRFNVSCHSPSPRGHSLLGSPNSTLNDTAMLPEMEPIRPDLCIEQLWTETTTTHRLSVLFLSTIHVLSSCLCASYGSYISSNMRHICQLTFLMLLHMIQCFMCLQGEELPGLQSIHYF